MSDAKPMGRPSGYSDVIATEICERLSNGQPLRVICRDDHMPAWRTVYDWMEARPDLSAAIARARERGFDAIAEECLEIADETAFDTKEGAQGGMVANTEWISRSKLRVETRLKLLAKWDPKRYGEKLEHAGTVGMSHTMSEEMAAWLDKRS